MKKIFIFLAIIVVILCVILYQYNSYQRVQNAINSENSEYEQYLDKEIYGIDIASLINKSTDKNEKNSGRKRHFGNGTPHHGQRHRRRVRTTSQEIRE